MVKLNPAGSALERSTFLGGPGADAAYGVALDSAGGAYLVGGATESFPTSPGAFDATHNGDIDAFAAKLNATWTALDYATYLGGSGYDLAAGLALDGAGNLYLSGHAYSEDFPITVGAFDTSPFGGLGGFVTKLNSSGSGLVYSSYVDGIAHDVAVDGAGSAHLTGYTYAGDFPTTPGAIDRTHNGEYDVFVTKVNPLGTGVDYSTLLGSDTGDLGEGIAVHAGRTYVTGLAWGGIHPTPGAYDSSPSDGPAFALRLDAVSSAGECADGVDNDGDTRVDFPADRHCDSADDASEAPQCADTLDNDADGKGGLPGRHRVQSVRDDSEAPDPQCSNGVDDDGDGRIDHPADRGCTSLRDNTEAARCDDGARQRRGRRRGLPGRPGLQVECRHHRGAKSPVRQRRGRRRRWPGGPSRGRGLHVGPRRC